MLETWIREFNQKVTYDRVTKTSLNEREAAKLYYKILEKLTCDYQTYRNNVGAFLSVLEASEIHSITFGINLFNEIKSKVLDSKNFKLFDISILATKVSDSIVDKFAPILRKSLAENKEQRISNTVVDLSTLTQEEKMQLCSLYINGIQSKGQNIHWTNSDIEGVVLNLGYLRKLLASLDKIELFYHAVGIFFERLTTSEHFQLGRDIAEEIIICSFQDGVPEYGFLNSFRLYANQASVHAGLMYANLSLLSSVKNGSLFSEKYAKDIIWQSIKFFRNVGLFPWAIRVYNSIPTTLHFLDYERRSLDHSYFFGLIEVKDAELPERVLDYLNKEREAIISGGVSEVTPWLITLYNINRIYPEADFSQTGLGFYLQVFESIVPAENIEREKNIIFGNSGELKQYLLESLIKLNETRNRTDFVYDNEGAIRISNRLLKYCIENRDAAGFLLAMLLKSDYSILFKQKESKGVAPIELPNINISDLDNDYENNEVLFTKLDLRADDIMIWLGRSEGTLYELSLINKTFHYNYLDKWNFNDYNEVVNSDYIVDLSFEDTVNEKWGIRQIFREEHEESAKKMKEKLSFSKLIVSPDSKCILIVKDMGLSKYPHNLFLNDRGDFISEHTPVTNVLSTEWLSKTRNESDLPARLSKSIWIPTVSMDMTLNYLFGKIEDTVLNAGFKVYQELKPEFPLNSDLNIICSHGAEDISETQILSQKTSKTYNLDTVVGSGKILIFFVCYSGSMKTEFFRNNITSLVKRFISNGYSAVIAPFWALDATIPGFWLPEFLNSLDAGLTIDQAVYNANMKVLDRYPNPAAWACLHLYGNPYLKIKL